LLDVALKRETVLQGQTTFREFCLHLLVALGFVALAVVWTFPLVLRLSTHLPGAGIGDNALFLWNFWWMRTARATGSSFLHTSYLLAPAGADLTLHTHTALPAFIGATLLGGFSVATALNVTTLGSVAMNGFCAYLLAWRAIRDKGPAIVAGIIFGTSPYIAAHLNGHFNLTTAWTIPLFALGVVDVVRGSIKWAVFAGIALAATAYVDYYYVIYEIVFACGVLLITARRWSLDVGTSPPRTGWLAASCAVIALDLIVIGAISVTGGFVAQIGPVRVRANDSFNAWQVLWVLMAIALWVRLRPRVRAPRDPDWSSARAAAGLGVMFSVFLLGSAPLLRNALHVIVSGQYVTQRYYWRSAPIGIDVLTLVLGNPFHAFWGSASRHVYAQLGIDLIESGAWLGVAPFLLAAWAVRGRWAHPVVRQWFVLGSIFLVWALGSHVHAAGRNTGLIVPEVLLRFVPIAANARMPGRAMVIVYLALAMLAATGIPQFGRRRAALACSACAVMVLADFWIAPFPTASIECPAIYRVLRDRPEPGAVAELPLGLGDGFGALTPVDHRVLVCQAIHGRPLLGGVLARLPSNVLATYRADPLIAAWLRLSGAKADVVPEAPLPDGTLAGQRMALDDVAFVMLNRRSASPQLRDYVEHVLPVTILAQDEERTLFVRLDRSRIGD
jgi:hypothetical protein